MPRDRRARQLQVLVRIGRAQRGRFLETESLRHVTVERIVCSRLIRDEIELLTALGELRHDVRGIGDDADGERTTVRSCTAHARERIVERLCRLVEIARLQTTFDS